MAAKSPKDPTLTMPIIKFVRTTPTIRAALKRLRLESAHDLLYHFPSRYSDISMVKPISHSNPGEQVTLFGSLSNITAKGRPTVRIPYTQATLTDINGDTIIIKWFRQIYLAKTLTEGTVVKVVGSPTSHKGSFSMLNPHYETLSTLPIDTHESLFNEGAATEFGLPMYPESKGVTSRWLYYTIQKILGAGLHEQLDDPIPNKVRTNLNLPDLATALVWIHGPKRHDDAEAARKRFAFEEIFIAQTKKRVQRHAMDQLPCYVVDANKSLVKKFISSFGFTPTDGQQDAVKSILADIKTTPPMSRLLEGDVGSGKTFVAAVVSFATVNSFDPNNKSARLQVAYMAPTEVLAVQLYENFIKYFAGTGVNVGLLTGSGCRKFPSKVNPTESTKISRAQLLRFMTSGEVTIVVGTHTLIKQAKKFSRLGLVIVDEQHRFGTKQRHEVSFGHAIAPHYLSMSATPIPRTLALTLYADLDLSVLDQLPSGRKPVITTISDETTRDDIYDQIRGKLENGRQLYVICPRISTPEPDEKDSVEASQQKLAALQLKSVTDEAKHLATIYPNYTVGKMHSKMKKAEKEQVMQDFADHKIDILVSTSVVEVGVNVPNATTMIIEGGERFGLAQLHQLRGRVVRSTNQAHCFVFANTKTKTTKDRLKAFVNAKNGFELAELDMHQRGIGTLSGIKQWGVTDLAMEALKNPKLVEKAREAAMLTVAADPTLSAHPGLKDRIDNYNVLHWE